jgi:hypothetical protein
VKRISLIIFLLLVLWIAGSAVFEWPPLYHYAGGSASPCINELRVLDGLIQQWALETKSTNHDPVNLVQLEEYFREKGDYPSRMPRCPSGGIYTCGSIYVNPVCSLATNTPPPVQKERVGFLFLGWRWKILPSTSESHRLPQ